MRADVIGRGHLIARLDRALTRAVTLLSAPAGAGKTTLLADWCEGLEDVDVAWLSLDAADDEVSRFGRYLVEALRRGGLDVSELLRSVRQDHTMALDVIVAAAINAAALRERPLVFVLDDYHVIQSDAIHDAVQVLADRAPAALHVLIASRTEPPLALSRLRARGMLDELRAGDLRFNGEESLELLCRVAERALEPEQAALLERRTEGWAAGLKLAALALRHRDAVQDGDEAAGDRYSFDYLAEEIFQGLDEDTRTFLLRTSVLPQLTGELCDAVSGQGRGAARLADLYRHNLFTVALDERDEWYRYHNLFRDFLHRMLARSSEPVVDLHRRAAEWLGANGFIDDALDHARLAGEPDLLVELVEAALPQMVARSEHAPVERWLRQLPPSEVRRRPGLAVPWARMQVMQGRLEEARRHADEAEAALADETTDLGDRVTHRSGVALVRASLARYVERFDEAVETCDALIRELAPERRAERAGLGTIRALSVFQRETSPETFRGLKEAAEASLAGGHLMGFGGLQTAIVVHRVLEGRLAEARAEAEQGVARLRAHGEIPALGLLAQALGEILYEWDDLDAAEQQLEAGIAANPAGADNGVFLPPHARAGVRIARGDRDGALAVAAHLEARASISEIPRARSRDLALVARINLWLGNLAAARAWAAASGLAPDDRPSFPAEYELLTLARVLVATDRAREALPLLGRLIECAEAGGRLGRVLEMRVVEAMAREATGDHDEALASLLEALRLGEPAGYRRTFIDAGPELAPVLRRAAAEGRAGAYAAQLLERVACAEEPATQRLAEPLSARELEVLRLLAAGRSNAAIADDLVVSLATVKTHVQNVYAKLDVHGRTQAVARAREVGLL